VRPAPSDVVREVLPNGLTLLVREDFSAPVVAVLTWVKSGYFHEDEDQVGIAHVAEHMYFNGTVARPGSEDMAREIKGLGGELNAGTGYAVTSYHVVLPAANLERALDIQADAFANPLLDGGVLRAELGAVVQELKRKLDTPSAVAREKMYELAHDVHRIRRWRIGTEEQLRAYSREHVRRWWDDHYVPSNAIVAVVGAVPADRAMDALRARFSALAPAQARRQGSPPEPPRDPVLRYRRLAGDVRQVTLVAGFRTVPALHEDAPALEVLATVLADGRASRLVRALREDSRLVTSVDATSHQIDDVGLFELLLELPPERLEEARRALFEQVGRAWREPPEGEEISRARRRIEAAHVFGRASMLGQARVLAAHEALGGFELAERWLADVLAVTPEDVARVARQYLRPENASIVEHVPESAALAEVDPASLCRELSSVAGEGAEASESTARPGAPARAASSPRAAAEAREPSAWTARELPGGARLVHRRLPSLPTVAVVASVQGGRPQETAADAGLTHLTAALLTRGTADLDAAALAGAVEGLGGSLRPLVAEDWWGLGAAFLAPDLAEGGGLLADALFRPRLDPDELAKERGLQSQRRSRMADQPLAWAAVLARRAAYGASPPGLPELGTAESVEALGAEGAARLHATLVRSALTLVVVGDVGLEEASGHAASWLARAGSSWARASVPAPAPFREGRREVDARRREQTAQVLLFPGRPAGHSDAPVLDVIAAFTSSLGGRFFEEIRTKRGLAYVVASGSTSRFGGGHFAVHLATSPEHEEQARDVLMAEMERLAREPAEGEELRRSQDYLRGGHALGMQGATAQAGHAAAWLGLGLPLAEMDRWPDRVGAVTRDDVARVAAELLRPERASWAVVRGVGLRGGNQP
jgi:zinc protease